MVTTEKKHVSQYSGFRAKEFIDGSRMETPVFCTISIAAVEN